MTKLKSPPASWRDGGKKSSKEEGAPKQSANQEKGIYRGEQLEVRA